MGTTLNLSPHAFDVKDQDANNSLTFQIVADPFSQYFSLTDDKVTVAQRMDTEAGFPGSVNLRVVARDMTGLEAIATVDITVYDINDNRPVFENDRYFGKVQGIQINVRDASVCTSNEADM